MSNETKKKKDTKEKVEDLKKMVRFCHDQFPTTLQTLASSDLVSRIQQQQQQDQQIVLIDVRTTAERNVSMISNAISLSEGRRRIDEIKNKKKVATNKTKGDNEKEHEDQQQQEELEKRDKDDLMIVCYCSVGYRSGVEAVRLQQLYPEFADQIYNLDGIVAYTHAAAAAVASNNNNDKKARVAADVVDCKNNSSSEDEDILEDQKQQQQVDTVDESNSPGLYNPTTNLATHHVHTFGKKWDLIDNDDGGYESVYFGRCEESIRLVQVGFNVTVRKVQGVIHKIRRSSCRSSRQEIA